MGEETKVSKAQQKAVHKYVKANYDRLDITVPKGKKDLIKAHAESHGESVNGFINRAIDETMERDTDPEEVRFTKAVETIADHYKANRWDAVDAISTAIKGLCDES